MLNSQTSQSVASTVVVPELMLPFIINATTESFGLVEDRADQEGRFRLLYYTL